MVKKYFKRLIEKDLNDYLSIVGGILIVGPKWCGKTTTAKLYAKSILELQNKDDFESNSLWADIKPSKLLEGEKPRLIDEWQVFPVL